MRTNKVRFVFIVATIIMLAALPLSVGASHSWGNYHWPAQATPLP
jgi:hypothetical protein